MGRPFEFKSSTNKAGRYSDDTSLELVKSLAKEYGISELDASVIFAKESTFGTDPKVKVNVLQLSPNDPENWKWVQQQIKANPSKAMEFYIRGGLKNYRNALDKHDGDFYKAMKTYHGRGEKRNTAYANEAQVLRKDILSSNLAQDKGFVPLFGGSGFTDAVRNVVTKDLGAGTTYEYLKRVYEKELGDGSISY